MALGYEPGVEQLILVIVFPLKSQLSTPTTPKIIISLPQLRLNFHLLAPTVMDSRMAGIFTCKWGETAKLTQSNYYQWRPDMELFLGAKEALLPVIEAEEYPVDEDTIEVSS